VKLISKNAVNQKINIATGTVSNKVGTKWCSKAEVYKLSKIGLGAANQITNEIANLELNRKIGRTQICNLKMKWGTGAINHLSQMELQI
jgi:hypothetical protein